jgi:hypothetical protein
MSQAGESICNDIIYQEIREIGLTVARFHTLITPTRMERAKEIGRNESLRDTNPVLLGLVDLLAHTSTCR